MITKPIILGLIFEIVSTTPVIKLKMLKIKVKAGQINNLTDARYFAAWEVDWLGFNLDASRAKPISILDFKAIKEWVDGVEIVAEFGVTPFDEIVAIMNELQINTLQLNGNIHERELKELKEMGYTIIKTFDLSDRTTWATIENRLAHDSLIIDYLLLDFGALTATTLLEEHAALLKKWCKKYPIILDIDVEASEIDRLVDTLNPLALGVKGGEEEKVGFKSYDELDEFFEVLEVLV